MDNTLFMKIGLQNKEKWIETAKKALQYSDKNLNINGYTDRR